MLKNTAEHQPISLRQLFFFFWPLALQAFSQSFTYPLVATVASRGADGALNHAGMAQAHSIMFFLGTFGGFGLMTTGLVYGKTRKGFEHFNVINKLIAFGIGLLQLFLCIPWVAHFLLGNLLGLPQSIEKITHLVLFYSIPFNILLILRNPFQAVLYNNKATGKAGFATIFRIILSVILSPVFCAFNLVGPFWATVCLTLSAVVEVLLSWFFSRSIILRLSEVGTRVTTKELLIFNFVLSLGGGLIHLSQLILGAFIVRAPEPERIAPIYFVTVGIVNALSAGATRMKAVVLAFPPRHKRDLTTFKFAGLVGMIFAGIVGSLLIPPVAHWYFINIQRLKPSDLPLVYLTVTVFLAHPLCVALRSRLEGLAAYQKRPGFIFTGQIIFMTAIFLSGSILLLLKTSGNLIGPIGYLVANLTTAFFLRLLLNNRHKIKLFKDHYTQLYKLYYKRLINRLT